MRFRRVSYHGPLSMQRRQIRSPIYIQFTSCLVNYIFDRNSRLCDAIPERHGSSAANMTLQQYLLEMGLPKAHTAMIWAIPAFCGCFIQPYVGIWSDTFEHPWGKRLPFILAGACGISSSILIFAWADDLGYWTALHLSGSADDSDVRCAVSEAYVILGVCLLSLAIQPLQCALRALPLDLCTTKQQFRVYRWASISSAIGQVLGCAIGVFTFPKAGSAVASSTASFRILCVASIIAVDMTVAVTTWSLRSRQCLRESRQRVHDGRETALHVGLIGAYRNVPRAVRETFFIQSLAWTGWFNFLYYNTRYVISDIPSDSL